MQISRISFQDPPYPARLHDLNELKTLGVVTLMEITGKVRNLGAGVWVRR